VRDFTQAAGAQTASLQQSYLSPFYYLTLETDANCDRIPRVAG
jgi:hypothetical protein